MKKFNFKWLLLSIILSIASINTSWATGGTEGTSITVYAIGRMFSSDGSSDCYWNNTTSTMKIDVRRDGNSWSDWGQNVIWDAEMTNTGKYYMGYPVYSYTFKELWGGGQIRVKHYVSDVFKENYSADWASTDDMQGKLYLGWYGGQHNWIPFSDDLYPIYLDVAQFTTDGGWPKNTPDYKMNDGTNEVFGIDITGNNKLIVFPCWTSPSKLTFKRISSSDHSSEWNKAENITFSSTYNTYKVTGWNAGACANDNINIVVPTTRVYYDNSVYDVSSTNTYLVIGHDNFTAYSKVYAPNTATKITNTKLTYYELASDTWLDATYFGFVGSGSSWGDGSWGSSNLSNATNATAAYKSKHDLADGHISLVTPSVNEKNTAISVTDKGTVASALNSDQTIKYSVSFDGGTTYAEQTSGSTPAQITISAYKFVDGTYNSVSNTSNSSSVSAGQSSTYSTSVPAGYTGATSLSYTSMREGYSFIGWYTAASGGTSVNSPYYPTGTSTKYARFKANQYTITLAVGEGGKSAGTAKVYFETTALTSITHVTPYIAYAIEGYYDGNTKVLNADGTFAGTDVTGYITDGKWTKADNCTLTAKYSRRYAFVQGGIAYYTASRSGDMSWLNDAGTDTSLPMTWDDTNHRFYVHLYATPAEVRSEYNKYFYFNTSSSSSSIANETTFKAYTSGESYQNITAKGSANKKTIGSSANTFILKGSDAGYVVLYLDDAAATRYVWYSIEYKVDYNGNGNTGGSAPDRVYHAEGADVTVLDNTGSLEKTGYTFNDWNTAPNGSGAAKSAGDEISDIDQDITLYAQWTANEYTITLNDRSANTGVSPSSVTATYDSNTLSSSITNPLKTGYTFAGWYTNLDGTGIMVIGTDGALVASVDGYTDASGNWKYSTGDITLYARWKVNASVGAYNFQYGSGTYYSSSWTIENFGSATDHERTVDFTMPDPTSKKYYVGYDGDFWSSGLGEGDPTKSKSEETNMTALPLIPSEAGIGTATGATGKLVIYDNSSEDNLYVGFLPSGYGVTYNGNTKAFHATPTEYLYETDVVTISAADITANAFKVQLATSSSYTDCALSTTETASTVNARNETMTPGANGRFYIWINSSEDNFALFFKTCNNYFEAAGDWSDASNWSLKNLPTIDDAVYIQKAVNVDIANAKAKSVVIDQKDGTGHLTIGAGKSLLIAGELRKKNSSGTLVATEEEDVFIDSDLSNGNGALIMKTHDGTNKATVNFATKAYKKAGESQNWVNQYIGTPFNDQGDPTYNYYGMELYAFNASSQAWEEGLATSMTAFRGYDLLSNSATQNVVLNMSGTLVASGEDMTQTVSGMTSGYEVMFANSWVAPIDITSLSGAFTGANEVIYIFNAGTLGDYETNSGAIPGAKNTQLAGQYTTIALNDIPSGYTTIPSMQAFSVLATASTVSLALNYKTNVYDPAPKSSEMTIEPTHAPRRVEAANEPVRTTVYVLGESGYGDNLRILEREDFTTDFDNGWEGQKLFGIPETPQLYAVNADRQMAVLAVQDVDNTVLGFQAGSADTQYTFSFEYDGEEALYLYDTKAEKETRITNDATYTFTTSDKAVHNRFVIRKTAKIPTSVDNINDGVKARKQMIDGTLYIIRDGRIYNAEGSLVK